jgi:TolB-like protein
MNIFHPALNQEDLHFSEEMIWQQVERVVLDTFFSNSPILKRFLSFIVREKLAGRANCLKEYTIGLNILNKPRDFNPQTDGIVRIHASRLRKALLHYYSNKGILDEIRISLPKGNYIPVFSENAANMLRPAKDDHYTNDSDSIPPWQKVIATVIPFHYLKGKAAIKNLADGLGVQLSTSLMKIKNLSVISYNAIRLVAETKSSIREIAAVFGSHYIFTGDIQCQKNMARISVEMFRAETNELVWSKMFERKITPENIFEVQDEIIHHILEELRKSDILKPEIESADSMLTVA